MRPSLIALATAMEGGAVGLIEITGTAAVTLRSVGALGIAVLGAVTTASALQNLGLGAFGITFVGALTTAAGSNLLNLGAAGTAATTLDGLTDVSAASPVSGAHLTWEGSNWQPRTTPNSDWVASQAQMEGASANTVLVSPGVQQYHPGMAKSWILYDASADTILASYNVASVVKNGTGDYTISFSSNFTNTNYAVIGNTEDATTGAGYEMTVTTRNGGRAAASVRIQTQFSHLGTLGTPKAFNVMCLGDQ